MYIQKTYYTGQVLEVEQYYLLSINNKVRAARTNKTSEPQGKLNYIRAYKNLRRLINANFDSRGFFATLTYKKGCLGSRRDILNYLRKLRRATDKLRYIYVIEHGKNNRLHYHVVIQGVTIGQIKRCWSYGNVNAKHLDSSGNYESIASYMLKEAAERNTSKLFYTSRGLDRPEPTVTTITEAEILQAPKAPCGWKVLTDSIKSYAANVEEDNGEAWQRPRQYFLCTKEKAPAWPEP